MSSSIIAIGTTSSNLHKARNLLGGLVVFPILYISNFLSFKIYVYTLAPGFVDTDMATSALSRPEGRDILKQSPLNRIARPDEIAKTIAFLSDDGNEYLTGAIIDINGASYLRT